MVHLKYALIALAAVVTTIWLALETSLAHSYATFVLSLYRFKEHTVSNTGMLAAIIAYI